MSAHMAPYPGSVLSAVTTAIFFSPRSSGCRRWQSYTLFRLQNLVLSRRNFRRSSVLSVTGMGLPPLMTAPNIWSLAVFAHERGNCRIAALRLPHESCKASTQASALSSPIFSVMQSPPQRPKQPPFLFFLSRFLEAVFTASRTCTSSDREAGLSTARTNPLTFRASNLFGISQGFLLVFTHANCHVLPNANWSTDFPWLGSCP